MRKKISVNQRGSSLPVAILICMLLAIGLVALQTSVMSFTQRTSVMHYEKQAYLSARNVATELANMLKEVTDAYILTYDQDQRNQFENLPDELKNAETEVSEEAMALEPWIHSLMDMAEGTEKEFENFTWNKDDVPADFDPGSIKATIKRNGEREFEIAATCTVEGRSETVKVLLSCTEFEKGGTTPEPTVPVEEPGNANILYSDYGFGLRAGDTVVNWNTNTPFVSSIPMYLSNNEGDWQDKIQSYGDLFIENFGKSESGQRQKTGEGIVSRTNLYLKDQVTTNAYLHAKDRITISSGSKISAGRKDIFAKEVYIHGDNITINAGTIYAERVIIDATNINLFGSPIIVADEVQIVKGSTAANAQSAINIQTTTGEAYWVKEPHFNGIDPDLIRQLNDQSEGVKDTIQRLTGPTNIVKDNIVYYAWVDGNRSLTAGITKREKQINLPATKVPLRYKPLWVDMYDNASMTAIPLETVEGGYGDDKGPGGEGLIVGEGDHYYLVKDGSPYDNVMFSFGEGMYKEGNNPNIGEGGGQGGPTLYPLVFIVENNATLYLSDFNKGDIVIYVILKGNAKLRISGQNYPTVRVYGEMPSTELHEKILGDINDLIQEKKADPRCTEENMVATIQNAIRDRMTSYWSDKLSMIILDDGAILQGTCVVPYIYSTGDTLHLLGKRYTSGYKEDESLDDTDGGTPPKLEENPTDPIKMLHVKMHTYSE